MKAVTWQGIEKVAVSDVPEPTIQDPTDAIVEVTSTAICGSDLHLYKVLAPFLSPGDIIGHEFMGIVREVGPEVTGIAPGDRVVVPFNVSCGRCWMCARGLYAQCETTQVTERGKGATLFGYTSLYGQLPGGQAQFVRVPHADFGPIKVPDDLPDQRFLFLSDILPTAWQGVRFADLEPGGTIAILGLGPVGQLAVTCAQQQGAGRVLAVDRIAERLDRAQGLGAEVINMDDVDDVAAILRDLTSGRGPDAVVDAVGMEAHGNPVAAAVISASTRLPKPVARAAVENAGIDRLEALHTAISAVRRGGTVSISGVYGGAIDPMPLMDMFDKGISLRMGQCHVRQWTDDLLRTLTGHDPFGVDDLVTHRLPLTEAPAAYEMFQHKSDGCIKVVLDPTS
ncbi:zinc-dependent alcohol dehydrogenase [Tessaracoccus palaemonis]|uniref:Glutathione-dependent formaldehyde dehydrogenase n=1 Tax=Tessaracoccus palaemonis TaxID=2829499 RepID=A0ABX8SEQ2_9ACTN|nr:zinc-dependent alcohol dehydrogenase [Tessaracoccus palaemonis]QXT61760.1 glutathione-dependent formaldehyde dehydrogenase [Tessaracoccus palaemonis]